VLCGGVLALLLTLLLPLLSWRLKSALLLLLLRLLRSRRMLTKLRRGLEPAILMPPLLPPLLRLPCRLLLLLRGFSLLLSGAAAGFMLCGGVAFRGAN
jgi:hypothetical protein